MHSKQNIKNASRSSCNLFVTFSRLTTTGERQQTLKRVHNVKLIKNLYSCSWVFRCRKPEDRQTQGSSYTHFYKLSVAPI